MHEKPFGNRVAHHGYLLTSCPGHCIGVTVLDTLKIKLRKLYLEEKYTRTKWYFFIFHYFILIYESKKKY